MSYEIKNFEKLLNFPGLSNELLKNHFLLYQGYVTNTNKILNELQQLITSDQLSSLSFSELSRRLGWEWNGMRLHELYFENLTQETKKIDPTLKIFQSIKKQFGDFKKWEEQFTALGTTRGIGWVILSRDLYTGLLQNLWINEHDVGHLVGSQPLIVMDVFEHAFINDYGLKRKDYINLFLQHLDWSVIEKR